MIKQIYKFNLVLLLALVFLLSFNGNLFSQNPQNDYEKFYHHFKNISADENEILEVKNLVLRRDRGEILFKNGTFFFNKPFNNRIYSAVFIGEGVFSYTPPNEVERKQLYRFFEKEKLEEKFKKIFLLFTDSTFFEISKQFTIIKKEIPNEVNKIFKTSKRYFRDENYQIIDPNFTTILLENNYNRFFSALIEIKGQKWFDLNTRLFYTINPFELEDVTLAKGESFFKHYWKGVINKFQSEKHLQNKSKKNKFSSIIDIKEYDIESNITSGLDFSARTTIKFSPLRKNQKWIYFNLYDKLIVDSVFCSNKKSAVYSRLEDSQQLWIKLQDSVDTKSLNIYYHGNLLAKEENIWVRMKSPIMWYPRSGIQKSKYNLIFHYPSKMKLASVGEKYFSKENDEDLTTSKWLASSIKNATFNIDNYSVYSVENDTIPNIIVYKNKVKGVGFNRNMDKEVASDVVNSYKFFQHIYGKTKLKNLFVCEHPYIHGQAFQGLINLSWSTFAETDIYGYDEIFRAHEVAHQWWGIGVDYSSYHDKWLSEAFAEYSGLWYMQIILQDNEKFFDVLDNWKEKIISNRKYIFGSGQESGPIWLGYRTESKETKGDYNLIIYKKGAWVLHMLRNMLLDLKTMNEDRFTNLMRDFFNKYNGFKASTEDFRKICDTHFNMDMSWFFNQWVYNTNVPTYKFSYKSIKKPKNKYLVKCKVKQENVPPDFIMYVPILIKFSGDRFARLRVKITGAECEFNLPLLPVEPEEVIFNDLNSVLCEVENIDWD